jgi:hypothetical protein
MMMTLSLEGWRHSVSFWQGLSDEREHDRWSAVNAAANAIYLALDVRRDSQRQSTYEQSLAANIGDVLPSGTETH